MTKYLGNGGWSTSANGTGYTGSPGEQNPTSDPLSHLSRDSAAGISRIAQKKAAARKLWNR